MKTTVKTLLSCLTVALLFSVGHSQERKALSVTDMEDLLKAGVTSRRLATLVEERGINFEVTEEIKGKVRASGASGLVLQALEKAGAEFTKKRSNQPLVETGKAVSTQESNREIREIEEAAVREGKINWYGTMSVDPAKAVINAFRNKYRGIQVDFVRASEDNLIKRIRTEASSKAYVFDVFISTAAYVLKDLGLALKWTPHSSSGIIPDLLDPEGLLNPVYINTNVIQYNTRLVPKRDVPTSYEDLASPKWRGKLCIEGSDVQWFMGLQQVMGKERAVGLLRRIAANRPLTYKGHRFLGQIVLSGECFIAVNNYGAQVAYFLKQGSPTDFVAINPVVTFVAAAAISSNAPHPSAAKLFVNWIASKEGQELLATGEVGNRLPVRADMEPEVAKLTRGVRFHVFRPGSGNELAAAHGMFRQVLKGQ